MGLASAAIAVASVLQGLFLLFYYLSNNAFPQPLTTEYSSTRMVHPTGL